jgi:hypothetical protein
MHLGSRLYNDVLRHELPLIARQNSTKRQGSAHCISPLLRPLHGYVR